MWLPRSCDLLCESAFLLGFGADGLHHSKHHRHRLLYTKARPCPSRPLVHNTSTTTLRRVSFPLTARGCVSRTGRCLYALQASCQFLGNHLSSCNTSKLQHHAWVVVTRSHLISGGRDSVDPSKASGFVASTPESLKSAGACQTRLFGGWALFGSLRCDDVMWLLSHSPIACGTGGPSWCQQSLRRQGKAVYDVPFPRLKYCRCFDDYACSPRDTSHTCSGGAPQHRNSTHPL